MPALASWARWQHVGRAVRRQAAGHTRKSAPQSREDAAHRTVLMSRFVRRAAGPPPGPAATMKGGRAHSRTTTRPSSSSPIPRRPLHSRRRSTGLCDSRAARLSTPAASPAMRPATWSASCASKASGSPGPHPRRARSYAPRRMRQRRTGCKPERRRVGGRYARPETGNRPPYRPPSPLPLTCGKDAWRPVAAGRPVDSVLIWEGSPLTPEAAAQRTRTLPPP